MRKFFVFAAVLSLLSACQTVDIQTPDEKIPVVPVAPEESLEPVVFSVSTEAPVTKTGLVQNGEVYDVVWKSGDKVRVNGYQLSIVESDNPDGYGPECPKALFYGSAVAGGDSPRYRSWYPGTMSSDIRFLELPSSQTYVEGGVAGFPMYAESDTESLQFKNLCGIIRINLKGEKNVAAIGLLDKDASPKGLSGGFNITDDTAVIKAGSAGVTLQCPTPVALNTTTFTSFFITVPAGSYGKLQITVSADDESYAILTSNKPIVVERSMITDVNISSPKFKNDKARILYTTSNTTQLAGYTVGSDASVFGDELTVVSHTYDSGLKSGVITLSGNVTKIGDSAFQGKGNLATITIPESVTSIGGSAFMSSGNLTTINWPEGLTTVGYRAFSGCSKFNSLDLTHITSIGEEAFLNTGVSGDIVIGSQLTSLGRKAFQSTKLTSVTFNSIPESMGIETFYWVSTLESVTFNCNVPALPGYTFKACSNLSSVTFSGTLGSIGAYDFEGCGSLRTGIDLSGTGITSIGNCAFSSTPLSASFDIPSSVTSIGENAFNTSTGLKEITIPDAALTGNGSTFANCTNLETVTFTGGTRTTRIPTSAFNGCTKLTSVNIPSCVTEVNANAFANCGLTSLPDGWGRSGITYGTTPFTGCPIASITFPDNWSSIPSQFCKGMSQLATVDFGHGLTSLGYQVFDQCWALTSVVIPAQMTTLSSHAFYRCGVQTVTGMNRSDLVVESNVFTESKLQSANISNWTKVPGGCFKDCAQLASVTLGEGLTTIDNNGFQNCTSLTSISFPSTLSKIGNYAFQGSGLTSLPAGMHDMTFGDNVFAYSSMTSAVFPAGMTSTGSLMFSNCTSLVSVDLGDVTDVAANTFYRCYALSSVNFSSVIYLRAGAFKECTSIEEVELPSTLVRMYDEVFRECTSLRRADIGAGVTQIGKNCFYNTQKLESLTLRTMLVPGLTITLNNASGSKLPLIYVPSTIIDTYKSTDPWSNYSSYFRTLDGDDRSGRMEDYNNGGNL